jgi:hypothetical protein
MMLIRDLRRHPWSEPLIGALLLATMAALLAVAAERMPLFATGVFGYDWAVISDPVRGGRWPDYGATDAFNPPWAMISLMPLAALPLRAGWAVLATLSLTVFFASGLVLARAFGLSPRLGLGLALVSALSFWSLRNLADGNLEAFTIGGCLLAGFALRARNPWIISVALLLMTSKLQAVLFLVPALVAHIVRHWPRALAVQALGLAVAVVVPSLLVFGADWLALLAPGGGLSSSVDRIGSNVSLTALTVFPAVTSSVRWLLAGLVSGVSGWAFWPALKATTSLTAWALAGAGLLAASLLVTPYTGLLSLASLTALAIVPITIRCWPLGLALMLWANIPFLTAFVPGSTGQFEWSELFQMGLVVATWLAACWLFRREVAA